MVPSSLYSSSSTSFLPPARNRSIRLALRPLNGAVLTSASPVYHKAGTNKRYGCVVPLGSVWSISIFRLISTSPSKSTWPASLPPSPSSSGAPPFAAARRISFSLKFVGRRWKDGLRGGSCCPAPESMLSRGSPVRLLLRPIPGATAGPCGSEIGGFLLLPDPDSLRTSFAGPRVKLLVLLIEPGGNLRSLPSLSNPPSCSNPLPGVPGTFL